jgi:hypothetical protein
MSRRLWTFVHLILILSTSWWRNTNCYKSTYTGWTILKSMPMPYRTLSTNNRSTVQPGLTRAHVYLYIYVTDVNTPNTSRVKKRSRQGHCPHRVRAYILTTNWYTNDKTQPSVTFVQTRHVVPPWTWCTWASKHVGVCIKVTEGCVS